MLLRSVRSDTALALTFLWGGCVLKNTGWCIYGRASDIATDNGTPMARCQRIEALLSFGGKDAE